MISYTGSIDDLAREDLVGFLSHWDFVPKAGALYEILKNSTHVILSRDTGSGKICGYITALSDGISCAYISHLEVLLPYRGQGIAKEMVRLMEEKLPVYGIYLSCAPSMAPFYENLGFSRVTGFGKRMKRPASPAADA